MHLRCQISAVIGGLIQDAAGSSSRSIPPARVLDAKLFSAAVLAASEVHISAAWNFFQVHAKNMPHKHKARLKDESQ